MKIKIMVLLRAQKRLPAVATNMKLLGKGLLARSASPTLQEPWEGHGWSLWLGKGGMKSTQTPSLGFPAALARSGQTSAPRSSFDSSSQEGEGVGLFVWKTGWLRAAQTLSPRLQKQGPGLCQQPAATQLLSYARRDVSAAAHVHAGEIFRTGCLARQEGASGCGRG